MAKSSISNAIVGIRATIGKNCTIQDAMIMGADYYESEEQKAAVTAAGGVPIGIGEGSTIRNAIIDKNARVGKNVKITNDKGIVDDLTSREAEGIFIRSGIVVINKVRLPLSIESALADLTLNSPRTGLDGPRWHSHLRRGEQAAEMIYLLLIFEFLIIISSKLQLFL